LKSTTAVIETDDTRLIEIGPCDFSSPAETGKSMIGSRMPDVLGPEARNYHLPLFCTIGQPEIRFAMATMVANGSFLAKSKQP
jgi:hypothetical protein